MIEIAPGKVESAFLYFHSAGTDSRQFKPFLRFLQTKMPHCYIWIGDGGISGSSLVLASAMMRKADPLKQIILFEPYLLEAYYLKEESIVKETTVICVDNSHIRKRTFDWLGIYTNEEFAVMGLQVKSIVVEEGDEQLDWKMIESAFSAVRI